MSKLSKLLFVVSLLSVLVIPVGCESEEKQHMKIDGLLEDICENGLSSDDSKLIEKYQNTDYFTEKSLETVEYLLENQQYVSVYNLLSSFEEASYKNKDIKKVLSDNISHTYHDLLSSEDYHKIYDCLSIGYTLENLEYYTNRKEVYPIEDIIVFARTFGVPIITKDSSNGYYYDKKDSYKTVIGRWYSPIEKRYLSRGEVGTYRENIRYTFYGDVLKILYETEWWTPYSERNGADELVAEYWYKDSYKFTSNSVAQQLLEGEGYFFGKETDFSMIVITNNRLILMNQNGTLEYSR